jgi:uncharacterized protein YkwD
MSSDDLRSCAAGAGRGEASQPDRPRHLRTREDAYAELRRTALLVRAAAADDDDPHVAAQADSNSKPPSQQRAAASHPRRRSIRRVAVAVVATAAALATAGLARAPLGAAADSTADQDLFSLTNQDRASNGVHALLWHSTLSAIGENKPYGGCGFTVDGRSYDMIQRNYFAHPILNCGGQLVFNMMSAFGVNYRSAGENIGWESGYTSPSAAASYINQQFMNSTEHRDNILNSAYTHIGIGSDLSPPGYNWTGAGSALQNVFMFSEEFAQLASSAPPPATPRPTPRPTAPAQVNGQQQQPPQATPPPPTAAATVIPTPTPPPTPLPTRTPIAAPNLGLPQLPLIWSGGGLIADSIESILEAFLVD